MVYHDVINAIVTPTIHDDPLLFQNICSVFFQNFGSGLRIAPESFGLYNGILSNAHKWKKPPGGGFTIHAPGIGSTEEQK